MFSFDDVMEKMMRAEEIMRTANMVEDEKAKNVLFKTVADILNGLADAIRPKEEADEDE